MKVRLAPALVAGAAALAAAAPANAAAPPPTKLYFHCMMTPNKFENASVINAVPAWDKNAPTTSFTAGGGCGFADPGALEGTNQASIYDGVWGGNYGGAIDKMVVELHSLAVSKARQGATATLHVRIGLDDQTVYEANPTVTPVDENNGATELFKFELDDIGIDPGDASRVVDFTVNTDATGFAGWVYDATEVPSNVTIYAPDPNATPTTASASKKAKAAKRRALARKRAAR